MLKYMTLLIMMCFLFGATCKPSPPQFDMVTVIWDNPDDVLLRNYEVHIGSQSGVYNISVNTGIDTFHIQNIMRGDSAFFMVTYHRTDDLESDPSNELKWLVETLSINNDPLTLKLNRNLNEKTSK